MLAPQRHAGNASGDDGLAAEEERGLHHLEFQAELLTQEQGFGDVRRILEAKVQVEPIKAAAKIFYLHPFVSRDVGLILGDHGQEYHAFMQHFIVRQIMQQGVRYAFAASGHEYGCTRDARRRVRHQTLNEGLQGDGAGFHAI